jgi:6-phosphogluconolactonase (cycloisomerase 2 family)
VSAAPARANPQLGACSAVSGALALLLVVACSNVATDPGEKSASVASAGPTSLVLFALDPATGVTGNVDSAAPGERQVLIALSTRGTAAYLGDPDASDLAPYAIDAATGALHPMERMRRVTYAPNYVVLHPSRRFAYLSNARSNAIFVHTIDPVTGTLSPSGFMVAIAGEPENIAFDPDGRFAFVAKAGTHDIDVYAVDAQTGALTQVAPSATASRGR